MNEWFNRLVFSLLFSIIWSESLIPDPLYLFSMKYIIHEEKFKELIKSYIMSRYDSVSNVYFTKRNVHTPSYFEGNPGRNITLTIINIEFNSGEMVHGYLSATPTRTLRTIRDDINSMFNLGIGSGPYSLWDIIGTSPN
jgi:hypothetical protein